MKRILVISGLLIALGTGVAQAQHVGLSLSFGDPYFRGTVVVGRPYYRYYSRPYYHRYRPAPVILVGPRYYRAPHVIVVEPRRYHGRRYHRGW